MSAKHQGEVRAELNLLRQAGHTFERTSGSGHIRIRLSNGKIYFLPSSPSDNRWRENARSGIARLLGVSKRQLEADMGITKARTGRPRAKLTKGAQRPRIQLVHDDGNDSRDPLSLTPSEHLSPDLRIELVSQERQEAQRAGDRVRVQRATRLLQKLYEDKRRSGGPTPAA